MRLKEEMDRVLQSVQLSREDLQRVSASSKSAVQAIPQLLSQQYKLARDVYEQQTSDIERQWEERVKEMQVGFAQAQQVGLTGYPRHQGEAAIQADFGLVTFAKL